MFSPSTANIVTILTLLAMPVGALAGKDTAMETETITHKYTNKLADETSPYLLQHAHNPVDWYPWSKEAFEIAKKHDKPVFLSIGYSTCHWCHVMERESFENEHIAKIMNEHFVCIKVDREQRPDVDDVYMTAVQMMTGSGGWPLSVFLTPDGKPFYGGTYFPPKDMYGRPGFGNLLLAIADAWKSKRAQLLESAGKISTILQRSDEKPGKETLSPDILKKAYSYLKQNFDSTHGGFGDAPKFPQPSYLSMLLRYWHRTKDSEALTMVETSLDAMAKGGIYDHLGGGFHRYSTDSRWLVPHFEKMLYDQALISNIYVQAYQATDKEDYAKIARDIFDYVLRDMTDPGGGFYSAEDADSEGKEGLFYVWELKEIAKILGKKNARIFNDYYGVTKNGNFEEGRSILNIKISVEELAKQFKQNPKAIESVLTQLR
ncbi:MAG: thioredoxin domain-containing protein, partial [Planctomycetota bacterium]